MKRIVLICFITCSLLSACDKKDGDPSPVNPYPVIPNTIKPVIVPDVETISATVEDDGSVTLKGKINKADPKALDFGFVATKDSLFGPVWTILKMEYKPIVGSFSYTIQDDALFEKGKKYYFTATVESSKQIYQKYNILSFTMPK